VHLPLVFQNKLEGHGEIMIKLEHFELEQFDSIPKS